ncbi:hypothetical protein B9Z55_023669 [Caenorhabditis nigoni]|nr:hypothetical protein B9Z55_023669 [Caenorhabditis nigoni]
MAEKVQRLGLSAGVDTDEARADFIRHYYDMDQIVLNEALFSKKPGKKAVAKLMLNSLKVDRGNSTIIIDPAKFYRIFHDKFIEITPALVVKHRKNVKCLTSSRTRAMQIAAYTTSYARFYLYDFMEKVGGENIFYADTDSIVYRIPEGEEDPLENNIGSFLGDLTSELSGEMLEFVALGPKTYCYKRIYE